MSRADNASSSSDMYKRPNERLKEELRALAPYLVGLDDCRKPTFATFASGVFVPTGMIPQLPVELIREIVVLADPSALPSLCLVNRVFKELAEARLYKHLELSEDSRVERCFSTLDRCPGLSKHVRRLAMHRTHNPEDLPDAYRALRGMANLTSLQLELCGSLGTHLHGSQFRLLFLVVVCDWDQAFVAWLAEQTELRSLVFWGLPEPGVELDDAALPRLNHVVGAASLVERLVPGRPVKEVLVSYATMNAAVEPAIETVWHRCGQSVGPVEIVNVGSAVQDMTATDFMRFLEPIPECLPDLLLLNIQALRSSMSKAACDDICTMLGKMKKLEALFVYSQLSGEPGYLEDRTHQRPMVKAFAQQCPTLRSVTLTHDIWAYCDSAPDKWITVDDVSKLLEDFRARCSPQDLMSRAMGLQEGHRAPLTLENASHPASASVPDSRFDLDVLLGRPRGRYRPSGRKALPVYAPPDYTVQLVNDDTVESMAIAYNAASSLLRSVGIFAPSAGQ